MSVSFRATTSATGISTSATGTVSGSTQVGDIQIAFIIATSSTNTITAVPSGWTLIRNASPSGFKTFSYWKVRAAGDTSSPVWTLGSSDGWGVDIWSGSGQHATNPINAQNGAVNTGALTVSVSVTPTVADCTLVLNAAADSGTSGQGRTWTQTAGMTERIDRAFDTYYCCAADQVLTGQANTAQSRSATVTGAATPLSIHVVAIAPFMTNNFMPFFDF